MNHHFNLSSPYTPRGDQPQAIEKIIKTVRAGKKFQTLLGITGSGKTFTLANVITALNKPALVISHNKTLAAQLFQEFRDFFPHNAVNYFVSYYDYYQPEAYIAATDTYIEKDAQINDELDKLRHATTSALMERSDIVTVASVSCIYGLGSPEEYKNLALAVTVNLPLSLKECTEYLINLQYEHNPLTITRGSFRRRESMLEIGAIDENALYRIHFNRKKIVGIEKIAHHNTTPSPLNFEQFLVTPHKKITQLSSLRLYPAKHYTTPKNKLAIALANIKGELTQQIDYFKKGGELLAAERIQQRTTDDLEMLKHTGFCKGVENYERHLYFRRPGEPPATLFDYYPQGFITIIDESHITIPQLNGMYHGDRSRKETLVNYGFRLPSAFDHRPLKFSETMNFLGNKGQTIFVSATPGNFEIEHSIESITVYWERLTAIAALPESTPLDEWYLNIDGIAEQLIRPTGLLDPRIEIRSHENPMVDVVEQTRQEITHGGRILILTITKRLAEAISEVLKEQGFKTNYLHSEIKTLDRPEILKNIRLGTFDVLVGINLLREGLDLPEVSLIIILEGDKEGFLRNRTSLIQMVGRAARHLNGRAIIYAHTITESIKATLFETNRRRTIQEKYNQINNITPQALVKGIKSSILPNAVQEKNKAFDEEQFPAQANIGRIIRDLEKDMKRAAKNMEFETAAQLRDRIEQLKLKVKN